MATKLSQNNALIISNFWAYDWHRSPLWRQIVEFIGRIQISLKVHIKQKTPR